MAQQDELDLNSDELIELMKRDELEDMTKLSPRDYGKLRGIAPQLVYYHIREGHVDKERCACGRSVIDIDKADQYFKKGKHSDDNREEG